MSYMLKNNDYMQAVLSHFNVGQAEDLTVEQIRSIHVNLKKKKLV